MRAARIVHEIGDQPQFDHTPRAAWKVELHEFLALAETLTEAGYTVGPVLTKIDAITAAIDRAITPHLDRYLTDDLVQLDPGEVAERVRQAGVEQAAHLDMVNARDAFHDRLARDATTALRGESDRIVTKMRRTFDPALEAVRAAAGKGLTPHTDTRDLLDNGDPDTIDAYRALGPAVSRLDQLARLRIQMATIANIGPHGHPMASLIAHADNLDHLEGAQNVWRGDVEIVQYDQPHWIGSSLARVQRPRLGGAWLALVTGGYQVRLNTAAQADAVLVKATG